MMKISKPVLMNDFMFSHVQFTSLNLVSFKNVKPFYDGNENIILEYEYPSKVEVTSRDWIGMFPRGWNNLQQYVTFEWISQSVPSPNAEQNKENGEVRRTLVFYPKYHMNCVNQSAFYQFVYVGKQIEVLGVSSYFRFDLSNINESSLEVECLVPVTGKIRSSSVSDFGALSMGNGQSSTSLDSRKLIHTSSIHSLQYLDVDGKASWSKMNFTDDKKNLSLTKRAATLATGTGDNLDPYSSHSEPVFPMSLQATQCKKCYHFKRGGEYLRSQQALQSKVGPGSEEVPGFNCHRRTLGNPYFIQDKLKIVMERNKVLEERAQEMKKEMERLQNESKRIKMSYYNVNKEKVAYEKFVKDLIKSLEKDSIVRVMHGNSEILVKKVNYVGIEEHPRDKKTSKRERELKAVIGLQEITIRNLINSLQEKAKSVQELNQTVKLAQVLSTTGTANRELDHEESCDELSSSDFNSEYEFSLAKPQPPEEVSGDAEAVLDSIRKKSEIELKNIGISKSLGNNSDFDLDMTNLSVMTYESDDAVSKKTKLVDNIEDCWPFLRNPTKTLRQKLSEEVIEMAEESKISSVDLEDGKASLRDSLKSTENEEGLEMDTTNCEDYYDAYDGFSVKSLSSDREISNNEADEKAEENEGTKNSDALMTAMVPKSSDTCGVDEMKNNEGNLVRFTKPEKINKFTCEFSIDFVHSRCQASGDVLQSQGQSKSEQCLVAVREPGTVQSQEYALERERSLISFKKMNKCLEIKITKLGQTDKSGGTLHQKMVVQFTKGTQSEAEENSCQKNELVAVNTEGPFNTRSEEHDPLEEKNEVTVEEETKESRMEMMDIDAFSPRTEWIDATEILEGEEDEEVYQSTEVDNDEQKVIEAVPEKITEMDSKTVENEENFDNTSNIQMSTEDNITNLRVYQDSLLYEKNLQFLNGKFEGENKEIKDETLKEKPSAILIQSGQDKVALIRYQ